jgi:hypothetical protein
MFGWEHIKLLPILYGYDLWHIKGGLIKLNSNISMLRIFLKNVYLLQQLKILKLFSFWLEKMF